MSEQYRCSECGHFVEIPDDAICDVCNIGIMQHLRYTKGGDGSHWDGCEEVHWDCRIAQLEAELARLTALVERLKEDGERLASTYVIEVFPHEWVCRGGCHHWARFGEQIEHSPDCPITLHRALMKEVE